MSMVYKESGRIRMIHRWCARLVIWLAKLYLVGRKLLALGLIIFPFIIHQINLATRNEGFYFQIIQPFLGLGFILLLYLLAEGTRGLILNQYRNVPKLFMIIGIGLSITLCLAIIMSYFVVFGIPEAFTIIPIIILLSPLLPLLTRLLPQKANELTGSRINRTSTLLTKALLSRIDNLLHPLILSHARASSGKNIYDTDFNEISRLLNQISKAVDSFPEDKLRQISDKLTTLEFNLKLASTPQQRVFIKDIVSDLNQMSAQEGLPEALPYEECANVVPSMLTKFAIILIYSYRNQIRRKSKRICAYYPSCSRYTELSLLRFGIFKGGWIALQRMSRCHSMSPGGYDPVPGF